MKASIDNDQQQYMKELCASVKRLVFEKDYESSTNIITNAMELYPHAAEPHNLMGIVLEKTGDHAGAMKHFRAAWALDPTYLPANHNLTTYGTFYGSGNCAFDEDDVQKPERNNVEIVYDERGIGHARYKNEIVYDRHGIGHVVRRVI